VPDCRNQTGNDRSRGLVRWALPALLAWPLLAGASCEKSKTTAEANPAEVVKAADNAAAGTTGAQAPATEDKTPLPGVDVSKLDAKAQKSFYKLVGTLTSPCGKAHSLRTSVTSDPLCKRAPFAARYIAALLEDGATEEQTKGEFDKKYKAGKTYTFKLDGAPMAGTPDAPIKLVEFFDYGCPSCQQFKPVLDQVAKENAGRVVVYYKMYPLAQHVDSKSAAQAALAAHAQGKFKEMHDILFERSPKHRKEDVLGYAKELGLDLSKFEADYNAAEPRVKADQAEGDANGVDHTPTLYFNGRAYEAPFHPRYLGLWIEEEMAVNR